MEIALRRYLTTPWKHLTANFNINRRLSLMLITPLDIHRQLSGELSLEALRLATVLATAFTQNAA